MRHHPVRRSRWPLLLSQPPPPTGHWVGGQRPGQAPPPVCGAAFGCGGAGGAGRELGRGRKSPRIASSGGGELAGRGRRAQGPAARARSVLNGSEDELLDPEEGGPGRGRGLESGNFPIKLRKVPPPHVRPMTPLPPNFPPARRYKSRLARSPRPTPRHLAGSPAPAPAAPGRAGRACGRRAPSFWTSGPSTPSPPPPASLPASSPRRFPPSLLPASSGRPGPAPSAGKLAG